MIIDRRRAVGGIETGAKLMSDAELLRACALRPVTDALSAVHLLLTTPAAAPALSLYDTTSHFFPIVDAFE